MFPLSINILKFELETNVCSHKFTVEQRVMCLKLSFYIYNGTVFVSASVHKLIGTAGPEHTLRKLVIYLFFTK